jgi:hypothetical protein
MKGSDAPVGGTIAVITAMFKRAFKAIQIVTPAASRAPK